MRKRAKHYRKHYHSSINKNIKKIEDGLLFPTSKTYSSSSKSAKERISSSRKRRSSTSISYHQPSNFQNETQTSKVRNQNSTTRNEVHSNQKHSIDKTRFLLVSKRLSQQLIVSNTPSTEENFYSSSSHNNVQLSSLNKNFALYRLPRNSGLSCLVQDSNGQYRRKTVFFVSRKNILPNQTCKNDLSSCKTNGLSLNQHQYMFSSRNSLRSRRSSVDSSKQSFRYLSSLERYVLLTCPHCVDGAPAVDSTKKTELHLRETIDEQIDPTIGRLHPSRTLRFNLEAENNRSQSCFSRFFFSIRKMIFPNFTRGLRQRSNSSNFLTRLLSAFKGSSNDRQSSDSISSTSTSNRSNLFCWTCFEMDGEDETLSSVDSGSVIFVSLRD